MAATVVSNIPSLHRKQPQRPKSRLRPGFDWLLAGTHPEPDDIRTELLHQRV